MLNPHVEGLCLRLQGNPNCVVYIDYIESFCVPDDFSPDILQFAPVNVISTEDCQEDWIWMNDLYICIRDDSGEQGACFVSTFHWRLYFKRFNKQSTHIQDTLGFLKYIFQIWIGFIWYVLHTDYSRNLYVFCNYYIFLIYLMVSCFSFYTVDFVQVTREINYFIVIIITDLQ